MIVGVLDGRKGRVMPQFVLKAAVADYAQLAARASYLVSRGLPVRLELHTFGKRDIATPDGLSRARANIDRLINEYPVDALVVHVPLQSVPVVTQVMFDTEQCEQAIAFASEIGAEAVVLHRYFALVFGEAAPRGGSREEATAGFEDVIRHLARAAGKMRLLVENVGHYSLLPRDGFNYLSGPLDHFFPWEVAQFRQFLQREGLSTVEPFIDVAHATLSSNLFNRKRCHPRLMEGDPRFTWITQDDLDRANWLEPLDFVDAQMPYLHVSDALRIDRRTSCDVSLAPETLTNAICSEGLEIGEGNLPFAGLPDRFGQEGDLVLEVEPGTGEDHARNGAQLRSLEALTRFYAAE